MKPNLADYGPDLTIRAGQIGEIWIKRIIEDAPGSSHTAVTRDGGILILRITPEGLRQLRKNSPECWSEERRAAVAQVISAWANATGKAYAHNLEWHASKLCVVYAEVKAACFLNPGRHEPPLRLAYEQGLARRRDTFNRAKTASRAGARA